MEGSSIESVIRVGGVFLGEEEIAAAAEVMRSGRLAAGPRAAAFERRFADYLGCRHAVALNSGTAALHLSLAALGIGPGDEVIVPPLTFFSTVASVLYQGAVPVFADIEEASLCLDPADVRRRLTPRTRAILAVHLFGDAADVDGLGEIAAERGIALIEDAAQAHGTEHRGRKVGAIGDVGVFSFYATKHMTTGEGGALVTDRDDVAHRALALRNHGMSDPDTHRWLGYNYRMPEVAAAIGLVQLGKLDALNERRIANSERLLDQVARMGLPGVRVLPRRPHVRHTYFWCPVLIDPARLGMTAEELAARLLALGVETRSRYREPLYRQPLLRPEALSRSQGRPAGPLPRYGELRLPVAERVAGSVLGLPNHPGLGPADLDRVAAALAAAAGAGA
ncbi:MAG: DegT/DnrJ/EryC1/StrS family aminotransferase [Nitrospinota bacterium]